MQARHETSGDIEQIFAGNTFGANREDMAAIRYNNKVKQAVFNSFIKNIVIDRAEVRQKKEVLDILQTDRTLHAWRMLTRRSVEQENEQMRLAVEYNRVGYSNP